MALTTSFITIHRGSRMSSWMGLKSGVNPGNEVTAIDGSFIGLQFSAVYKDGEEVNEIKRNQHVFLDTGRSCDPAKNYKVLVEPNPILASMGSVQPGYLINSNDPFAFNRVGIYVTFRSDVDINYLKSIIGLRLYLMT